MGIAARVENAADSIREALEDIKDALRELDDTPRNETLRERAKGYPLAHIAMALNDDHMYLGGSMVTLQDIIDEIDDDVLKRKRITRIMMKKMTTDEELWAEWADEDRMEEEYLRTYGEPTEEILIEWAMQDMMESDKD